MSALALEAAITSGCTRSQVLWKVRMPIAFPEIMLGVNQTIMFALFMVIIAAFIGTRDLGQEIFRALTFNDAGKGLVVGLCVAFIGLTVLGRETPGAVGRCISGRAWLRRVDEIPERPGL